MNHRQRLSLRLGVLLFASLPMIGCCIHINGGPQFKARRQDQLSSAIGPDALLAVRTDFGSITITGGDANECRVTAEVTAHAPTHDEAEEILDKVKVVLEPTVGGLSLHVDKPTLVGNRSVGVSFTVTVPTRTALDCHTSFGSIRIQDITASVKADTSFASVTADRVRGPLRLTTSHGAIRGNQITSDNVVAESSFGNVELTYAAPPDANGTNPASGSLDAKTSFGSITCRQVAQGRILTQTSFGSVRIECLASAPPDLQLEAATSHGSITCQVPSGFAGQVHLDTSFGEVQTDRSILVQGRLGKDHLTGTIGEGKGRVRLKTEFGNITLR